MTQRSLRSNTIISEFPQEPALKKPRKRNRSELDKMDDEFTKLSEVERSTKLYNLMMGFKISQDKTTSKLDSIEKQISDLQTNQTTLISRVDIIESNMNFIQNKVQQNDDLTNYIHQQALENDIVLMGLPQIKNDELPTIIQKLNAELEMTLDIKRDFKKLFIQNDKNRRNSIIKGKLYNLSTKDKMIENFKKKKPITAEKIATLPEDSPFRGKEISITGNLTAQNRFLLKETQKFKHIFQYIWADNNGRILARKNEKTPAIHIKNVEHLNKIVNEIVTQSFTINPNQTPQPFRFASNPIVNVTNNNARRSFQLTQPTLTFPNVQPPQNNQPTIATQMDWNSLNQPNTTN